MLVASEKTLSVLREGGMDVEKYQKHFDRNEFSKDMNSCTAKLEIEGKRDLASKFVSECILVLGTNF